MASLPPFVKTEQLADRVFEIMNAECRASQFGPEVVFTLRALDDATVGPFFYTQDGDPVYIASWSASETPSRKKYATWFANVGADTLGPCMIEWVPTAGANPFANIVDCPAWADATVTQASSAPAPALSGPTTRPAATTAPKGRTVRQPARSSGREAFAPDEDAPLDDLPF